jgi:hypothetical protein
VVGEVVGSEEVGAIVGARDGDDVGTGEEGGTVEELSREQKATKDSTKRCSTVFIGGNITKGCDGCVEVCLVLFFCFR